MPLNIHKNESDLILEQIEEKRRKELAQQTAPLSFAYGGTRSAWDTANESDEILAEIYKKNGITLQEPSMKVPYTVDRTDYDKFPGSVQQFSADSQATMEASKPSTLQKDWTGVQSDYSGLKKQVPGLSFYAGGNKLNQFQIDKADRELAAAYQKALKQAEKINKYSRDVDYDLGENVKTYADWVRVYEAQTAGDEKKTAAQWGQQWGLHNMNDAGNAVTAAALENATDDELAYMLSITTTAEERSAIQTEQQRRQKAAAWDETQRAEALKPVLGPEQYAKLPSNMQMPSGADMAGWLEEERDALRALGDQATEAQKNRLSQIDGALAAYYGEPEAQGPAPLTPEVGAYADFNAENGFLPYAQRYTQEYAQSAQDWRAVAEGAYQGDDQDMAELNRQIMAAQDAFDLAAYEAALTFDYQTGAQKPADEIAALNQRKQEAQTTLEALQAQAEEKAKSDAEKAGSVRKAIYGDASFWRWLGASAMEGAGKYASAFYGALDFVFGKPATEIGKLITGDKNYKSGLTQLNEWYKQGVYQPMTEEAANATASMGGGMGWEVARQTIGGIVENVPNTIMAIMTGGASTAAGLAGTQAAAVQSMADVGKSAGMRLAQDMLSNPNYWTSFMQEIEGDYEEAMRYTDNPLVGSIYAMVSTFINAGIEIGAEGTSGVQGITREKESGIVGQALQAITGKDFARLDSILSAASDEALEELKQGIVSGLAKKALLDNSVDWISFDGSDAVLNAQEIGTGMLVGGLTGGLLAAGVEGPTNYFSGRSIDLNMGQRLQENGWFEAIGNIAENVAGIQNDVTAAMKDGSFDGSKKKNIRNAAKVYRDTIARLDDGSFAAVTQQMQKTVDGALEEAGFAGTPAERGAAAAAITKAYAQGPDSLTADERHILDDPQAMEAYKGLTGEDGLLTQDYSQERLKKSRTMSDALAAGKKFLTRENGMLRPAQVSEAARQAADSAQVSEDGQTYIKTEDGGTQPAELVGIAPKEGENGKTVPALKARVDGEIKIVDFEGVTFANKADAERAAVAALVGGEEEANTIFNGKDPSGSADFADYAVAFDQAYTAAASGMSESAMQAAGIGKGLTQLELDAAEEMGRRHADQSKEMKLAMDKGRAETIKKQKAAIQDMLPESVQQRIAEAAQAQTEEAARKGGKTDPETTAAAEKAIVNDVVAAAYDIVTGNGNDADVDMLKKYGMDQDTLNGIHKAVTESQDATLTQETLGAMAEGETPASQTAEFGAEAAYQYGLSGRSQEELARNLKINKNELSEEVRKAYARGEKERIQGELKREQRLSEVRGRGRRAGLGAVRSISQAEVTRFADNGVRAVTTPQTSKQRAAIDALRKIANYMHLNIALFESTQDENGRRVGSNGFYDPDTRTVYLDLFAGQENEQAILRTAAHELTHVLEDYSPREYAKLRDFLIKTYYSAGENTLAELVQHQLDVAAQNGKKMSETQAMREVVADASEMLFSDTDAIRAFAQQEPTLFERIKNWIEDFCDAIRRAMEGVDAQSREARLLTGMQQQWEEYRRLWLEAAAAAAENMQYGNETIIDTAQNTAETVQKAVDTPQTITGSANIQPVPAESANQGVVYTGDNTPINFHYELAEADELITSNTLLFAPNPDYPQELQPRDRSRQASREQVRGMARDLNPARLGESADVQSGAPIVGPDLVVESGNGRTMAIQYAMKNNPASAMRYTQWLRDNAARFGLNPADVTDGSILVRVRDSAADRVAFVKAANESVTAAYSESETAESDAEKLTPAMMELFYPSEDGRLDNADNASFANRFMERVVPAAERGNYMQQDGSISQRGWERMQNAVFQRAYGSAQLTQLLSESTDEGARNILKALLWAAPRAVQTQEAVRQGGVYDVGLGEKLTQAAKRVLQLKREGIKLDTYMGQTMMPGVAAEDADTRALMRLMDDYARAPRRMAGALQQLMDLLEEYGDPRQVNMLGESAAPTLEALIAQAMTRENAENTGNMPHSYREQTRDAAYMQAVENDDMEEAQRLVDEAAEEAMRQSAIRDEDGRLLTVYHGTSERFNVFDMSKGRANMDIQGSFFSPWELDAQGYGENVGRYYLNIKNPASESKGYKALNRYQGQNGAGTKAREYLISQGYDGVNNGGEEYIAFYPWQIKSADAVAYDDAGNVIPLSERFNEQNADIRFSDRDTEYRTNRQILGEALLSVAANEQERQMLENYQDMAAELDAAEKRIGEINTELRTLRYEEQGSQRESDMLSERRALEQQINEADKRLYNLERMAPLQRIAREQRLKAENDLQRAKQHMQRYREGLIKREHIASIDKTTRRLAKWLTAPAGKSSSYVPEGLRAPLGEFLLTLEKMSQRQRAGGEATKEDQRFAYQLGQISRMLQNIDKSQNATLEEQISSDYGMYLDLPQGFTDTLLELEQRVQNHLREAGGKKNVLDQMSVEELEALDTAMATISASISGINTFLTDSFNDSVKDTAEKTIKDLNAYKPQKQQSKLGKFVSDYVTWDNAMPSYVFERFGEAGARVFDALRKGQAQLAFNAKQVIDESEKAYTKKEAKAWSHEIKEFDFAGEKIRIPVSHIMSLYCLNKREQGIGHLYGEGVRVADFKDGRKVVSDKGHVLSEAQVQKMIDTLTPRQKAVADRLQYVMSTLGSEWGNYVSMRRFGFRQFTEKNYFPIKSDSDLLPARTEGSRGNELTRLLNMSAAKPLTPKANSRLMLMNIFDVFGEHMADMAQYNALALPILDTNKWFNYKSSTQAEGETAKYTQGVRDSMRNAFGQQAIKYVSELLKDVNGTAAQNDTNTNLMQKMLGKYNRVAVAANLRVALLQPLAIIRAGMELPGTSLAGGTIKAIPHLKKEVAEMQKYSGIALWKDLGYREMNVGRSVSEQIKHMETWQDVVSDKSMALAGIMDNLTWGAMWKASKEYINRTQPTLRQGSEEYFTAVTRKFEDVVYKTQVVDSILTKSQLMRSNNLGNKIIGSFMSEPTTTFNTLMAVWDKFRLDMKKGADFSTAWQRNGKMLGRTMFYYLLAAAINTAIEQAMTAYRDDDDYETLLEKFKDGFWQNLADNMNPLELLPGVKQLWEQGGKRLLGMDTFDDQNVLTQGVNTITQGIEKLIQGKGTVWGRAYTLAKGLSITTGLPVSPLMREFQALWNNTAAYIQPKWRLETSPTPNATGYDILYKAFSEGDETRFDQVYERMLERGEVDEKKIQSAMNTRIKNDLAEGNISEAEAQHRLTELAGKTANDAYFKVQEWGFAGGEDENYSRYGNLEAALMSGSGVEAARKELTAHGVEEKAVTNKIKSFIAEQVVNGGMTDAKAMALLKQYAGMTDNEAWIRMQELTYQKRTGNSTTSDIAMVNYAIEQHISPQTAIDGLLTHGKEKSGIASAISSKYKEIYLELYKTDISKAATLKGQLISIYEYLGYNGMAKIRAWENEPEKKK